MKRCGPLAWILVNALLPAGCATIAPAPQQNVVAESRAAPPEAMGWWAARYRMDWPDQEEPRWYLDLLLAHRVVAPVLQAHRDDIRLWRFHRRAGHDAAGHQFSFIFYSTPAAAQRIFEELRASPDLRALSTSGRVINETYSDTHNNAQPRIADTSDPNWSPVLKQQWPYFIMGVSELWLGLVSNLAGPTGDAETARSPPRSLRAAEARYRKASAAVDELWQAEGGHALLHHLSAVFGYRPLYIQEKRLLGF